MDWYRVAASSLSLILRFLLTTARHTNKVTAYAGRCDRKELHHLPNIEQLSVNKLTFNIKLQHGRKAQET